ncbi:hypothetical protein DNI29_23090 [Hymenobacter sediminis]|uniref:hypothetical protein n=1 Tax=Hymenobacter sediminis TaxID=2218621 RepID=UPI000DA6C546|nr:hypothetical protein [Hymenobacter sediminis]RPD43748.1 hypothetical protein DNI29_23090 [Hymenobacter sediminis]
MLPSRSLHSAALLSLLALSACQKAEAPAPNLPAATQTGQNTAGAKVDGHVWLPATTLFVGPATQASYQRGATGNQLTVMLSRTTDVESAPFSDTSIRLYVPNIRTAGSVALNQYADPQRPTQTPAYATFTYAKSTPAQVLLTGPGSPGQLTITRLDTVAHIVAGTFEFKGQATAGTGTVSVTEGRFDVKY